MTISSASLKSSSGNPSTLCISTLLCESVNAGDFFSSSTADAPENDAPGRSASYDDANRATFGFRNDPSPVRFCLLRSHSRLAHQIGFGNPHGSIAQIIFDLSRITRAAAKDQPDLMTRTSTTFTHCADKGEVRGDWAFCAFLDRKAFPSLRRQPRADLSSLLRRRFFFRNQRPATRTSRLEVACLTRTCRQYLHIPRPNHRRTGHFGEIPFVETSHAIEKIRIHSIMLISI